jgi:hypothetical protein
MSFVPLSPHSRRLELRPVFLNIALLLCQNQVMIAAIDNIRIVIEIKLDANAHGGKKY